MEYFLYHVFIILLACRAPVRSKPASCITNSNLESRIADPRCDVFWEGIDKHCQGSQPYSDLCHEKWDEALKKCNKLMGIESSPPTFIFLSKDKGCKISNSPDP